MVKIVCISDTHSQNLTTKWEWPEGDILIHAGDLTAKGSPESIKQVARQLHQLPYRYKVIIPGNHDRAFWEGLRYPQDLIELMPGIIFLLDESVKLMGLKIYGTSWLKFKHGTFPFEVQHLQEKWDLIPSNADVLITHMPPFGIMDINSNNEPGGSKSLLNAVRERVRPKLHVYGHMHRGYGTYVEDEITYVNASLTGNDRKPANQPITVEL